MTTDSPYSVGTVESMAVPDGTPHAIQQAFVDEFAVQCGFCIPGFIVASASLLGEIHDPTDDDIRLGLSGNLCRCTGYENVVRAVAEGARQFDPHSPWETEPAEHKITLREAERRARERSRA